MSEEVKRQMSDRTKIGLKIFQAAVLLGVAGDVLLRATPWGLNVLLWMLIFVAAISALRVRHPAQSESTFFFAPLVIFAAFFAWRDSPTLMLLDGLAILLTLALMTLQNRNVAVKLVGVARYASGILAVFLNAALAPLCLLFGDIKWATMPRKKWMKIAVPVLRGLAVAVPLLGIFGALLMAADAAFDNIVRQLLNIQPEILLTHGFVIGACAWASAGILHGLFLKGTFDTIIDEAKTAAKPSNAPNYEEPKPQSYVEQVIHQSKDPKKDSPAAPEENAAAPEENISVLSKFFTVGVTEMSVILGLMNFLFLGFVVVQIKYFFGGAERIQQIADLTYADYARRGFFELVWVAALVLPVLLVVHWALRKDNPRNEKIFRALAGGQVALLFVIMTSALQRMFLYQNEYGLTELRVYTTAFMFWLATVFVIFALTVLIGKRERFTFAAYLSALLMIVALQFVNPDKLIVQINLARLDEGKVFDAKYAAQLSADAIPMLTENVARMSRINRCIIEQSFLRRRNYEANADWRSWNFSRQKAWNLVESNSESWQADCPALENSAAENSDD